MADAHLNGSLNLPSAEEVFRTVAAIVGEQVTKIPDGETDERRGWIAALVPRLQQVPQLEAHEREAGYSAAPRFTIVPGVTSEQIDVPELGYAAAARYAYPLRGDDQRDRDERADADHLRHVDRGRRQQAHRPVEPPAVFLLRPSYVVGGHEHRPLPGMAKSNTRLARCSEHMRLPPRPGEGLGETERSATVSSSGMTSRDRDSGQREKSAEPAAAQPADDEAGQRSSLSDSMVGLFDRLRAAAETHDGE